MRTFILITLFCGTTFTSSVLKLTKLSDESNTVAPCDDALDGSVKYEEETIASTEINPMFLEGLKFDFEPKFTALNDEPSPTVHKCGESKEFVIQVEEPSEIQTPYNETLTATNVLPTTEEKETYIPPIANYSDQIFSKPPQLPIFNLEEFVKNQKLSEKPIITPLCEKPAAETSIKPLPKTPEPEMFIRFPDLQTTQDVNEHKTEFWNFAAPPVLPPQDYKLLFSKVEEASNLKEKDSQLPEPVIVPSSMSERIPELPQLKLPEQKPELHQRLPHRPEVIPCNSEPHPLYPTHDTEQFEIHPNHNILYNPSIQVTSKPPLPPLKLSELTKLPTLENNEKQFQVYKNIPPGPTLPQSAWRLLYPKSEIVPSEQTKTPTPTYIPPCTPCKLETKIAPETKLPAVTILPHIILPQTTQTPVEIPPHNEYNPHLPPQENYEKQSQVYKIIPPGPTLPHSACKSFFPKSEIVPCTDQPITPPLTYMPPPTPETTITPETILPTVTILPPNTVVPHIILPQPANPPVEISPNNEYNPHHHHHKQTSEPCTFALLLKKKCPKNKRN